MLLKELYTNSIKLLKDKGILTANLDVKILLAFLLNIDNKEIINYLDNEISNEFFNNFQKLLSRRLNREPIANIIGKKAFWDHDFIVNENVLTPRPDSETLIEAVLENYKNKDQKLNILDLGTGSGCLILTLLSIYQNSQGLAIDISDKALEIAKQNAKLLNINSIKFLKNNWNDNINEKFDIIISNPPYIPKKEIEDLEPEVNKYNPLLALDGGNDGLDCYKYLAENLQKNCKRDTKIFLEIGKNQENYITKIFKNNEFELLKMYKDINGIVRVLEFKKIQISKQFK